MFNGQPGYGQMPPVGQLPPAAQQQQQLPPHQMAPPVSLPPQSFSPPPPGAEDQQYNRYVFHSFADKEMGQILFIFSG